MVSKGLTGERARKNEDKLARRETLLKAAGTLWNVHAYPEITMAEVAREAGLAKGTLYLYFPTKEALFLGLLEQLLWRWFETAREALGGAVRGGADEIAARLCATLNGQEGLIRLLSILNSVLEHHISPDTGRRFKAQLAAQLAQTGALLERQLPELPPGAGTRALLHFNALVIGLHHLTADSPTLRATAQDAALRHLALRFHEELPVALSALLRGSAERKE